MIKHCSVCGVQFTSKSNGAKYCPDCSKKVRKSRYAGYAAKNKAKRRSRAIQKHKNDGTYGKNKVILFNFQWWAIVQGSNNYIVIKKTRKESCNDIDIWDVVREAVKRGRVSYYNSLESALSSVFDRMLVNNAKSKRGYGADLFSLKNLIVETKKEFFAALPQSYDKHKGQINADIHRQKNEGGLK